MSISPAVDEHYRLQVADLNGAARQVEVANVTYQGVEEMIPVLHFVGQTKRLVMSPQQVSEMLEITGTVLYAKWIGTQILLEPRRAGNNISIHIQPLSSVRRGRPMPAHVSEDRRGWIMAISVVSIILIASIIVAAMNLESLVATLQQVRDTWLLR